MRIAIVGSNLCACGCRLWLRGELSAPSKAADTDEVGAAVGDDESPLKRSGRAAKACDGTRSIV